MQVITVAGSPRRDEAHQECAKATTIYSGEKIIAPLQYIFFWVK